MCSDNRIPLLGKVPLDPAVGQVTDFINKFCFKW
jgi:hypothetical protein